MKPPSKGEISFTFMTKVLQSILDEIDATRLFSKEDSTTSDTLVEKRKEIDGLYTKFERFWKPTYESIKEIYGEEVAQHVQMKLLRYHIIHHKNGLAEGLWALIAPNVEYKKVKNQVLKERTLESYLA